MTDSILFWNAVALEANRVSHSDPDKREQTGPTLSSRALAIVHLAMYDAYAGVENNAATFPRYLTAPPPPPAPGASHRDAVAGAALTTLSRLFKTQTDFFEAQLSCFDTSNASFKFGVKVGEALLELRANDMDARECGYQFSNKRGRHRVDPDNPGQGFYSPFYGAQNKGFAISKRWKLDKPPLDNPDYVNALKQVRAKGIKPELMATLPGGSLFNNRRTAEESVIGVYWAYDGANRLGTPPRQYNQIIRVVAEKQNNSEGDNARLFAFVNAAMGDAGILAWEQKYCHDLWRPVVGIREHDKSFGPGARDPEDAANNLDDNADPFWLPLGAPNTNTLMKNATPNFPAYPSGHATFGAAAFHIARLFYGKGFEAGGTPVIPGGKPIIKGGNLVADDLFKGLGFVSDEFNGGNRDNQGTVRPRHVRNFDLVASKPEMIIENAVSRIYLGVHWIFDAFATTGGKPDFSPDGLKTGGVPLGLRIAEDIFKAGGGKAPKMSPAAANPPIETPPPKSPLPTTPAQPASVSGCANRGSGAAAELEMVKVDFLSGTSPR
jgi:vanadium chloroperoxidase